MSKPVTQASNVSLLARKKRQQLSVSRKPSERMRSVSSFHSVRYDLRLIREADGALNWKD